MNAKRNLQDDLRGTYAKSWTVSIDCSVFGPGIGASVY